MSRPHERNNRKGNNNSSELSFYWQHYGLTRDPFSALQDDSMYLSFPQWEHHLDLLRHLIKNENVLLAIVGNEGMGKTTFAHQLIEQSDGAMRIHHFKADSLFSTRKLVHELERGFDLKAPQNTSPEDQLDSQIEEVQYANQTCLLLIDNAHFLPLETLTSLLFLLKQQSTNQMRLHILLFGDKHLQAKLSSLAKHELRGEMIHSIELEPLTLEETEQYIQHRLRKTGLNGLIPLSQMSIEHIYSVSRGIPERINHLVQQALIDNIAKQEAEVKSTRFKRHKTKIVGGTLLLIALAAASYILNQEGEHPSQLKPSLIFADRSESLQLPTQKTSIQAKRQVVATTNNPKGEIAKTRPSKPVSIEMAQIAKIKKPEKPPLSLLPPAAAVATELAKKEVRSESIRLSKLETISALPEIKSDHIDIISHPQLASAFKKAQIGASMPSKHKINKTHQAHKVHQIHTIHQTKSNPNLHKPPLTLAEKTLLKIDPHWYTLQVLGVSHKAAIKEFIASHHLGKNTTWFQTTLHGKPWYILLYGKYPTHQAAEKAIRNLPEILKQFKPWVRRYTRVQQAIKHKG